MKTFPSVRFAASATAVGVLLVAMAGVCHAQFEFVDVRGSGVTFPTPADRRVYTDFSQTQLLTDSNMVAGLWFAPGNNLGVLATLNDGVHAGGFYPMRGPTSVLAGSWLVSGDPRVLLTGLTEGDTAVLQIRVWDVSRFNSPAAAQAGGGFVAFSCPFLYTIPRHETALPNAYYMDNLRAFPNPLCVPEPSTVGIAAACLGLMVLAARRRPRAAWPERCSGDRG